MFTHSDLAALKRAAKKASKTDLSLSHTQHLDRLSRERFGVRNYHELQKRVQSGLRLLDSFPTDGFVPLDFANAEHSKLAPLDEGKLMALTQWKNDNPSADITDWPEWNSWNPLENENAEIVDGSDVYRGIAVFGAYADYVKDVLKR